MVNKISYEGSKWYVKLWRKRWYAYAVFLHLNNFIDTSLYIDLLLHKSISRSKKRKLRNSWKSTIHYVELHKMHKLTSEMRQERED